ncbi:uncharacterized protein MONBRDRAFT_7734 [Monosiga brevicollis MX1]|uniref:Uncharacterized protein n=1 Tax=Monosiga brevicollis TaxID=81824 RepID=A9UY53_MONBE|nr:uncharacterized protein MONBRDRAFT_7734 [Monosiga brevicollis MX1]EDQ89961.1 predicted protein [Monosiga brevicollis MX1]|eukprot:XP_001745383.1 hypothetical protein [Monosiga brevicollis MX1]
MRLLLARRASSGLLPWLVLTLWVGGQGSAASVGTLPSDFLYLEAVGPLETVFNTSDACSDSYWNGENHDSTDSMPIAWYNRATNETYLIAAVSEGIFPNVGPTLSQLTHRCDRLVFNSSFEARPNTYANYQWLQSVHLFPNGTAFGLVHNEFHGYSNITDDPNAYCSLDRHEWPSHCNLWSTGLARSDDGARTFHLVAQPPQHLLAALPYQYVRNQSIYGYGAISITFQGDDGVWYGYINVLGEADQASGACPFRTDDPFNPQAYRGWDGQGYSVAWHSAYGSPLRNGSGLCTVYQQPFTNTHQCPRRILGLDGVENPPTYVLFGQGGPDLSTGALSYGYSWEPDFAKAITNFSGHATVDLGVQRYLSLNGQAIYGVVLDDSSPDFQAEYGLGDNFEVVTNYSAYAYINVRRNILRRRLVFRRTAPPSPPPPMPPPPASCRLFSVVDAADAGWNGIYAQSSNRSDGLPTFVKDESHVLYRFMGVWRLGHPDVSVAYVQQMPNTTLPEPNDWRIMTGLAPAPAAVMCAD